MRLFSNRLVFWNLVALVLLFLPAARSVRYIGDLPIQDLPDINKAIVFCNERMTLAKRMLNEVGSSTVNHDMAHKLNQILSYPNNVRSQSRRQRVQRKLARVPSAVRNIPLIQRILRGPKSNVRMTAADITDLRQLAELLHQQGPLKQHWIKALQMEYQNAERVRFLLYILRRNLASQGRSRRPEVIYELHQAIVHSVWAKEHQRGYETHIKRAANVPPHEKNIEPGLTGTRLAERLRVAAWHGELFEHHMKKSYFRERAAEMRQIPGVLWDQRWQLNWVALHHHAMPLDKAAWQTYSLLVEHPFNKQSPMQASRQSQPEGNIQRSTTENFHALTIEKALESLGIEDTGAVKIRGSIIQKPNPLGGTGELHYVYIAEDLPSDPSRIRIRSLNIDRIPALGVQDFPDSRLAARQLPFFNAELFPFPGHRLQLRGLYYQVFELRDPGRLLRHAPITRIVRQPPHVIQPERGDQRPPPHRRLEGDLISSVFGPGPAEDRTRLSRLEKFTRMLRLLRH